MSDEQRVVSLTPRSPLPLSDVTHSLSLQTDVRHVVVTGTQERGHSGEGRAGVEEDPWGPDLGMVSGSVSTTSSESCPLTPSVPTDVWMAHYPPRPLLTCSS